MYATTLGLLALAVMGLTPAFGDIGASICHARHVPWASEARELQMHPVMELTDRGELLVSGHPIGLIDASEPSSLQAALRDELVVLRTQLEELRHDAADVRDIVDTGDYADGLLLVLPPTATAGALKTMLRAANAANTRHVDLAVETWARY